MANTKETGTAVAVAEANLPPAEIAEFLDQEAGRGLSTNANDVGIPYISILQDLSPQVKARDEAYIEGAEVGMIFHTQTKELIPGDEGFLFIPCFFKSAMVEWVPRKSGGGWVAEHPADTPLIRNCTINTDADGRRQPPRLPNGNDLIETKYYYGIAYDSAGIASPAVLSFSSSGLKVSRDFQGQLQRVRTPSGAKAPSFAKAYRVKTKLVSKNNNDWFVFDFAAERWVTSSEFAVAKAFADACELGNVVAARPDETISNQDEQVL